MNIVIETGRLTRDPETKTVNNSTVVSFTIAVDRGDKAKTADFFRCEAWGHTGDFIAKYFTKGNAIEVMGALRTQQYEKNGEKREVTKILVNNAAFPIRSNYPTETSGRNTDHSDADNGGLEF